MSGDIHSGVQEVHEPLEDLTAPRTDPVQLKDDANKNAAANQFGGLSTQLSTASTASDGSLCCEICNIRVTSSKILQRHLEGRKHKSRAERRGKTFHCDLCDVTANSEIQLNIHLSSSKHKTRVAREECKEFFDVSSYTKSIYVLLFAVFCIVINLVILVKVAM